MQIRKVTRGPGYHWFGYYDKLQFDPTGRFLLGMETAFEHRSPRPDDVIKVGMVDLADHDRWIDLGESRAWCWQQGCMLQWIPGTDSQIIWNDRRGETFFSHILDVATGERRTLDSPVYALSPDGRWAVTPDFRRINDTRPGYGYAGPADPFAAEDRPDESGLWLVDLETGERKLILSIAQAAALESERDDVPENEHIGRQKNWFNHLLVSPGATRIELLHRWRGEGGKWFHTRMLTVAPDGSGLRVVDDYGHMSHFIWRDEQTILGWARRPSHGSAFYLFDETTGRAEPVGLGVMRENGHCTYLPGNEWILNDTYPQGRQRLQELYLYRVADGRRVELGAFHLPETYDGEWRCDLHPRSDRDGRQVCIDSVHEGDGRQMYLLDISEAGQA